MKTHLKAYRVIVESIIFFWLLLISGCVFSNSYPSIEVSSEELGKGRISDYLHGSWMNDEKWIAKKITEFLIVANKEQEPRASAESIGMHCDLEPSKICTYQGSVRFKSDKNFLVAPKYAKPRAIRIIVILSDYDHINNVDVEKAEYLIN